MQLCFHYFLAKKKVFLWWAKFVVLIFKALLPKISTVFFKYIDTIEYNRLCDVLVIYSVISNLSCKMTTAAHWRYIMTMLNKYMAVYRSDQKHPFTSITHRGMYTYIMDDMLLSEVWHWSFVVHTNLHTCTWIGLQMEHHSIGSIYTRGNWSADTCIFIFMIINGQFCIQFLKTVHGVKVFKLKKIDEVPFNKSICLYMSHWHLFLMRLGYLFLMRLQ